MLKSEVADSTILSIIVHMSLGMHMSICGWSLDKGTCMHVENQVFIQH